MIPRERGRARTLMLCVVMVAALFASRMTPLCLAIGIVVLLTGIPAVRYGVKKGGGAD